MYLEFLTFLLAVVSVCVLIVVAAGFITLFAVWFASVMKPIVKPYFDKLDGK